MSSFFKRFISPRENPGVKLIVFDFDGTLADTRELLLRIIRKHLLAFEIYLTKEFIKSFGNTPLEKYVSFVGVPNKLVRSVCSTITYDFMNEYHKIKSCKNLISIKSINIRKVIVSNNVTPFIQKTLGFLRANFFDHVYGSDNFDNKVTMIKSLCKKYGISTSEVIYVGDKNIDVDVARQVGCYSIIIAGKAAWSSRGEILVKRPDYVLTDLGKLYEVIAQLNMKQLSAV